MALDHRLYFDVRGKSGYWYRFHRGLLCRIDLTYLYLGNQKIARLCIYSIDDHALLSSYDELLAMKLLLEANETEFVRRANFFVLDRNAYRKFKLKHWLRRLIHVVGFG